MNVDLKINSVQNTLRWQNIVNIAPVLMLVLMFTACSTSLQTKVAGNLNQLSKHQTVAILPVEIMEKGQQETAAMFRQGLYANLKQSKFNLLERYVVDSLLKKHNLTNPAQFIKMNPMEFAEILGVDAILISRINKVERSYLVIHSSIEIGISTQMVDTRTGEILWRAEQTESDFQGIGKIPTGISAAIFGPIQFVTNKLNLHRMTSKLVNKLTAIVRNPENAEKEETFEKPLIASTTKRDLKTIEDVHDLEAKWAEDVAAYTEIPSNSTDIKENPFPDSYRNFQTGLAQSKTIQSSLSKFDEKQPPHINWIPRKSILKPLPQKLGTTTSIQLDNVAVTPVSVVAGKSILPTEKIVQSTLPQYTIQVGAYKTKTNASQMANSLSSKGYSTYIKSYLEDGATLFKVHVEKFSSKEQASEFANKLTNKENIATFITILNPS